MNIKTSVSGDPSEIDQGKPEQTDHLQRLKLTT